VKNTNEDFKKKLKLLFPKEYNSIINSFENNTDIEDLNDFIFFSIQNKILFNTIEKDLNKIQKKISTLYSDFFSDID